MIIPLLFIFISRVMFLSPWLEDWDSVQFVLALTHYDLGSNLPHAPGYLFYVLAGKLLSFVMPSLTAFNILSAISGTIAAYLVYKIATAMFDKKTGVLALTLFAVTPIVWMMSVSPLTNIVGLASFLFFAYYLFTQYEKHPHRIAFLGGAIMGFRATEFPLIAALLVFVTLKKRSLKDIPTLVASFLVGVASWIVPTIIATGPKSFYTAYEWISRYVVTHDSFVNQTLAARRESLSFLLETSVTIPLFVAALFVFGVTVASKRRIEYRFQFLMVWILAYLIPLMVMYNLEVPRYTLPLVPPLIIFVVSYRRLRMLVVSILFVVLFWQSYSQVTRFKNATPPSIAPILYVKQHYSSNDTAIIASYTYRQFAYYAPEFLISYEQPLDLENLPQIAYLVLDFQGHTRFIPESLEYTIVDTKTFYGDKDIFSRLSETRIVVLKLHHE